MIILIGSILSFQSQPLKKGCISLQVFKRQYHSTIRLKWSFNLVSDLVQSLFFEAKPMIIALKARLFIKQKRFCLIHNFLRWSKRFKYLHFHKRAKYFSLYCNRILKNDLNQMFRGLWHRHIFRQRNLCPVILHGKLQSWLYSAKSLEGWRLGGVI